MSERSEWIGVCCSGRITKIKTFACKCVRNEYITLKWLGQPFVRKSEGSMRSTLSETIENYLWHWVNEENWAMAIETDGFVVCVCVCRRTYSHVSHFRVPHHSLYVDQNQKPSGARSIAALSHECQCWAHRFIWLAIYLSIFILFTFADMQTGRATWCQVQGRIALCHAIIPLRLQFVTKLQLKSLWNRLQQIECQGISLPLTTVLAPLLRSTRSIYVFIVNSKEKQNGKRQKHKIILTI